jgi:cysteinyl-tRNA synthetase
VVDGVVAELLDQRDAARTRRDFTAADAIRDRLKALGVVVTDTPDGPRWSLSAASSGPQPVRTGLGLRPGG